MSNFLHTKYFSFFDSGASAIHSALIACNVTYGDIGCFSFMPVKQLASCGELGGICTNNVDLKTAIKLSHRGKNFLKYHIKIDSWNMSKRF